VKESENNEGGAENIASAGASPLERQKPVGSAGPNPCLSEKVWENGG
jgi:hypothetical protein